MVAVIEADPCGEGYAEACGHLPGDTEMAPAIGQVAGHVEVVHRLGCETEGLAVRLAERGALGKDHDAGVVVAEAQLARRAQHAVALDPEDRLGLDDSPIGHRRAGCCQWNDVACLHVERATPHVSLASVAGIDVDTVDLRCIGVPLGAHDPRRDDAGDGRADVDDLFDREAEIGHRRGDAVDVVAERSELVEPRVDDLHQNCSRKRTSLLYISRTSAIACRSLAMRSMPNPKAKPLHSSGSRPPARSTFGMHHAAAAELQPLARRRLDVELGRGLGEREVARPQSGSEVGTEERLGERVDRAGEVGQGDAPIDHQTLELVEHGEVRRVGASRCGTRVRA